ncbi:MAG: inorganic diphosphatase, partial [Candidatus Paceibacteria bacterium]
MYSTSKFEYDEDGGYFALDRTLYSPLQFPIEYGFIPQTKGEDGDALDVLVIATRPTFPGCVVEVRPVGVLKMSDEDGVDHKVVAVPKAKLDPRLAHIEDISDVNEHTRKEVQLFMEDYKKLEPGKYEHVQVEGFEPLETAKEVLNSGAERFDSNTE